MRCMCSIGCGATSSSGRGGAAPAVARTLGGRRPPSRARPSLTPRPPRLDSHTNAPGLAGGSTAWDGHRRGVKVWSLTGGGSRLGEEGVVVEVEGEVEGAEGAVLKRPTRPSTMTGGTVLQVELKQACSVAEVEAVVGAVVGSAGGEGGKLMDEGAVCLVLERLAKIKVDVKRGSKGKNGKKGVRGMKGKGKRQQQSELLSALKVAVEAQGGDYNATSVASVLCSLGKLEWANEWGGALGVLLARGEAVVGDMKPLALLMVAKALTILPPHPRSSALTQRLIHHTVATAPSFSSHQLATVLRWFTALRSQAGPTFGAITPVVVDSAGRLNAKDLLTVLSSFASIDGEVSREVLSALEPHILVQADNMGRRGLLRVLTTYAGAVSGVAASDSLFPRIEPLLAEQLKEMYEEEVLMVCTALSANRCCAGSLPELLLRHIAEARPQLRAHPLVQSIELMCRGGGSQPPVSHRESVSRLKDGGLNPKQDALAGGAAHGATSHRLRPDSLPRADWREGGEKGGGVGEGMGFQSAAGGREREVERRREEGVGVEDSEEEEKWVGGEERVGGFVEGDEEKKERAGGKVKRAAGDGAGERSTAELLLSLVRGAEAHGDALFEFAEALGARGVEEVAAAARAIPAADVVGVMRTVAMVGGQPGGGCVFRQLVECLGSALSESASILSPSQAVTALRSYASAGCGCDEVVAAFEPCVAAYAEANAFSCAQLASLARAHHRMGAMSPKAAALWNAVARNASFQAPRMQVGDAVTLAQVYADSRCSTLGAAADMFRTLGKEVAARRHQLSTAAMEGLARSYATAGIASPELLSAIGERVGSLASSSSSSTLSASSSSPGELSLASALHILRAMATFATECEQLPSVSAAVPVLAAIIQGALGSCYVSQLVTLLWTASVLPGVPAELRDATVRGLAASEGADSMSAGEVATALRALATFPTETRTDDALVRQLGRRLATLADGLTASEVSGLLPVVTRLGLGGEGEAEVLRALEGRALGLALGGRPVKLALEEVMRLALGLARAGRPSRQLLESCTLRAQAARQLRPATIAAAASLCASSPAPSLSHALERHVRSGCASLAPDQVAHVAASFAKVGRRAPQVFASLAEVVQPSLVGYSPMQLVSLLWSFAVTGNLDEGLEEALVGRITLQVPTLDTRQLLRALQLVAERPEPARLVQVLGDEVLRRAEFLDVETTVAMLEAVAGISATMQQFGTESVVEALVLRVESGIEGVSEEGLVKALHACSLANVDPSSDFLNSVAYRLAERPRQLSTWAVVTSLWLFAMSSHTSVPGGLFPSLAVEVATRVGELKPHELASVVRSFSVVGAELLPSEVYDTIGARVIATKDDFSAQSLAMLLRSLSVAGAYNPKVFAALESAVIANAADMTPHGIATITRAYVTSKHDAPAVIVALATQATHKAPTFAPPALASTLWSCCSAGLADSSLMSAMARQTVRRAVDFDSRRLALTVDVYAKSRAGADESSHPEVFEALGQQAILIFDTFSARDLVTTIRAFVVASESESLRILTPAVIALGQQALLMAERFSPRQLSTLLWAYARLRIHRCTDLIHALAQEVALKAPRFEVAELVITVRAFSKLQYREPEVYSALADEVVRQADFLSTRDIADFAKAFAMSPVQQPDELYFTLARAASPQLGNFSPRHLSAFVFALAKTCGDSPAVARPGAVLDAATSVIARRAQTFSSVADLALVVRAYAALNTEYANALIASLRDILAKRSVELSPFEAAALLTALLDGPITSVENIHRVSEALVSRLVAGASCLSPRTVVSLLSASRNLPERLAALLLSALTQPILKYIGVFDLDELRVAKGVYRNGAHVLDPDESGELVSLLEKQMAQLSVSLCEK